MARPLKQGLDYFPMDTKLDLKLQLLKAKYKLEGIGFIDMLFRVIYEEGYFIKIDADNQLMLANDFGISEERFSELLNFCIEKDFFDKQIYKENQVLTSNGIQKRYFHGTLRRDKNKSYEFLTAETKLLLAEKGVNVSNKYTNKSKVKEIIINKIKEKNIKLNVEDCFIDLFYDWLLYKQKRSETYKTDESLFACYKKLILLSGDNIQTGKKIIENAFASNYAGFFPLNENNFKPKQQTQTDIFIYQIEGKGGFVNKSNINLLEIIKRKYPNTKTELERLKEIPVERWGHKKNLKNDDDYINFMADSILNNEQLESTRLNSNLKYDLINLIKKMIC